MAGDTTGGAWNPALSNVDLFGPSDSGWASIFSNVGWGATLAGVAISAVNAYYAVEANKGNLRAQASSLDFQADQARLNAERAERDAQALLAAGQDRKMALTLEQGQQRASLIAGQAASGTTAGGSNAEVRASQRVIARIEAMNLDSNTIREANAARTRSVNARNESSLAHVSAQNLRGTAGSMSSDMAAISSVFGSAGTLASQWAYSNRSQRRY